MEGLGVGFHTDNSETLEVIKKLWLGASVFNRWNSKDAIKNRITRYGQRCQVLRTLIGWCENPTASIDLSALYL